MRLLVATLSMRPLHFVLFTTAILIYAKGFLLSKQEIPNISPDTLSTTPLFKRSIIVVIDALRFDFCIGNNTDHYTGGLSIVSELLDKQPLNTLLFKTLADPPTTTMQRLKALVTGGLPTFIEAGILVIVMHNYRCELCKCGINAGQYRPKDKRSRRQCCFYGR